MAGMIYTPVTLWEGFRLDLPIEEKRVEEFERDGILFEKVQFSGRRTEKGRVKIYALAARDKKKARLPGLLYLSSYAHGPDESAAEYFAKLGYYVLIPDYGGPYGAEGHYTEYPEDVEYANATEEKDGIHRVEIDAKHTCWYEWGAVARYAAYYLKTRPEVSCYGAVGRKHGATVLWQLAAQDKDLQCFAATFSAGWRAYRGYYKFSDRSEPELNDELYKYLAAIEPQSYAQYVRCPVLMLTNTNSRYYDADRAHDTVARIPGTIPARFNMAAQRVRTLDYNCAKDLELFLAKYLKGAELELPAMPEITVETSDGALVIRVEAETASLKDLCLYAAEETVNPAMRCWNFKAEKVGTEGNVTTYRYFPYKQSGQAMFFAQARYENGFTVSSRIAAKKFSAEEMLNENKSNVVFSSRENKYMMIPASRVTGGLLPWLQTEEHDYIQIRKGAFEIEGITSAGGIKSLKINNAADKPKETSILLADVYVPAGGKITVKLIGGLYTEEETVYSVSVSVGGGEVWHKLTFPVHKFKTEEGMILKSMDKINMIEFDCENEYLLNNVLWV